MSVEERLDRMVTEPDIGPLSQAYGRYTAMEAAMGALQGSPTLEAEQAAQSLISGFSEHIRDDSAVMWVSLLRLADKREEGRKVLLSFIQAYAMADGKKRDQALHRAFQDACDNVGIQVVQEVAR